MARQHLAAQHEAAGPSAVVGRHRVGAHAGAVRAEGDGEAHLGHAVARDEGVAIKTQRLEGRGKAVEHVGADHVAADAGMAPARQVEIGRHLVRGAARGKVVAEARAVGDGAAILRDQVQPLRRPAREVARRQVVERELRRERRHQEADQAHVVIERQPAHGAIARHDFQAGRPGDAGEIGHQRGLGDLHAMRLARAARGELDVTKVGWPQRTQVDRLLRQRLDHRHPAVQAHGRELSGSLGQKARQVLDAHGRDRARGRKLATQLVDIGVLAADADRHRHRHRQQPGVLRAEEAVEEARPGVRRNKNALAGCEARADQAAGGDVGALADLAPARGRKNLTPDTIKGDPGLALGGIVQHLGHRAKIGAPQG